ncbi:metallopeptidase family protein [Candidatus Deferrimicrobium sp.]|jgi:predicted Zn-dependent protease with MMP-like domain|uniref:metallopeptidase family protein n=1 Tax=Candidatus Deferrimicrobium sp. TaxID=3060586 RepID=UPI002ED78809
MGRGVEFSEALRKALSELPPMFHDALANVAIVVEEWPPGDLLEELGIPPDDTLYGFYHGVPLPERSVQDSGLLPDMISVYRGPLIKDFPDRNELSLQIRITLLHEIGHYFGMDEEELSRLGYE